MVYIASHKYASLHTLTTCIRTHICKAWLVPILVIHIMLVSDVLFVTNGRIHQLFYSPCVHQWVPQEAPRLEVDQSLEAFSTKGKKKNKHKS